MSSCWPWSLRSPSPRRTASSPGATLNDSVTAGSCCWWLTTSGALVTWRWPARTAEWCRRRRRRCRCCRRCRCRRRGRVARLDLAEAGRVAAGQRAGAVAAHGQLVQQVVAGAELRRHFQHHAVLVQLGEDGGDLALAERVVQRVVDASAPARRAGWPSRGRWSASARGPCWPGCCRRRPAPAAGAAPRSSALALQRELDRCPRPTANTGTRWRRRGYPG